MLIVWHFKGSERREGEGGVEERGAGDQSYTQQLKVAALNCKHYTIQIRYSLPEKTSLLAGN